MFRRKKYDTYADEILMQRIGKSDEKAFTELYGRYSVRMYRYFLKMFFYNTEKAQDFMQDLFLKIIENPKAFNPDYKFSYWIYTVASNMCKNEFRRVSKNGKSANMPEISIPPDFQVFNGEEKYLGFQAKLKEALTTLDIRHKECFVLRYQEGFSVKEVSQILNCPEGTVKSRLFYSLKNLSKQLSHFKNYSR